MTIKSLCKAGTAMAVLALLVGSSAQAQTITGTEWDNPDITSVNREAAHTLAIPMAIKEQLVLHDIGTGSLS